MRNFFLTDTELNIRSYLRRDIFGVGGAMNAAATIAAASINAVSQHETNDMNYKIHQEDNAFNAAEAEKTRQWNSAPAIMERNKEAGINVALSGENATPNTPSTAQGSSAPAIPMQAPQIDLSGVAQGINSALSIAKVGSEIKGNQAKAAKDLESAKQLEIQNTYEPDKIMAYIENTKADTDTKRVAVRQMQYSSMYLYCSAYNQYMQAEATGTNTKNDIVAMQDRLFQETQQYSLSIQQFIGNLTKTEKFSEMSTEQLQNEVTSFVKGFANNESSNFNESHGKNSGWNVGGKIGASVSGEAGFTGVIPSGKVGASGNFELNGGYNSGTSDVENSGWNVGSSKTGSDSGSKVNQSSSFRKTAVAQSLLEASVYSQLMQLDNLNKQHYDFCVKQLQRFTSSAMTYKAFVQSGMFQPFSNDTSSMTPDMQLPR